MRRLFFAGVMLVLTVALAACTSQSAQGGDLGSQSSSQPATATPTPTLWTQAIVVTDFQGYKYSVQESTAAFSPMTSSDSGINVSAPPGKDWLDLRFRVTNLLADRSAIFQMSTIGIFGKCYDDGLPQTTAPNGQCSQGGPGSLGWVTDQPDEAISIGLAAGGTGEFHAYSQYPTSFDITSLTLWLNNCKGDGNLFDCGPLVGGVHLTPLSNG